jgi:hypothetical protein
MSRTACTWPQCLYSRSIPLLPLWAVRPVHGLSACTVELYLYSPYGPYGLYMASGLVHGCTLPFNFFTQYQLQSYISYDLIMERRLYTINCNETGGNDRCKSRHRVCQTSRPQEQDSCFLIEKSSVQIPAPQTSYAD